MNSIFRPGPGRNKLALFGAVTALALPWSGAIAAAAPAIPPQPTTPIDTSHATGVAVTLFEGYFRAKTEANLKQTMSYFSHRQLAYIDATVGLANYSWQSQYDTFAMFMPHWPAGSWSRPTQIIGDAHSAVVVYTDSAGLFGPNEIKAVGVVNVQAGKVIRWVDYWDGRQFGLANYAALAVPASKFPKNFATNTAPNAASAGLERVVYGVADALAHHRYGKAVSYFAAGAVVSDDPSHAVVRGPQKIRAFLSRAGGLLPYTTPATAVRHVVGDAAGGAFEWTARGSVPRGVCVLELNSQGQITRLSGMWNGALVGTGRLQRLASAASGS